MGLWDSLKGLLPGASRLPKVENIVRNALKYDVGVSLFFVDRQRQLENVVCSLCAVNKKDILLKSRKNFLPDILNNEQCSIYFKLPFRVIVDELKLSPATARYGFLCKSRIVHNSLNKYNKACEILIHMPNQYVQRELRRHERVYPSRPMIKGAGLWLPFNRLPTRQEQFGVPDFAFREDNLTSQLRIINLSAGGARVQVDNVEFTEELNSLDNTHLMLLLSIYKSSGKHFTTLTVCRCVESSYSLILRRLTLRLHFQKIWEHSDAHATQIWNPVEKDGVPAIKAWVAEDFTVLMSKQESKQDWPSNQPKLR